MTKNYYMKNKELMIVESDFNYRGFFSYVLQVLSNLYVADLHNKELLVNLKTPYNNYNEIFWNNYFYQPFKLKKSEYENYNFFNKKMWFDGHLSIKPILTPDIIKICNFLTKKYINIKEHILEKKNLFIKDILKTNNYASLHYRGTDHVMDSEILPRNIYFDIINNNIKNYEKFLICSDDQSFINEVNRIFKSEKIVSYPSNRSNNGLPIHLNNQHFKYKTGEDVLIESLLMAESKFLWRTVSNVTHFSIFKNENLKYKNLDEHLYEKYYEKY